jgi:hypothetical protein
MPFIQNRSVRKYLFAAVLITGIMGFLWSVGGHEFCYFKAFFGIPCPGCGLTRAFISFFTGDYSAAFFYHPLFLAIPLVIMTVLFRKFSFLGRLYSSTYFWIIILVIFLGVYIVRIILFFPDTPPMDFNSHAVLIKAGHYLSGFLRH